ncbi:MAG TPA: iron-sulfur cluster assembly accessory protein, partial [Rhodanobacter sp.]|nr:iron-sulfur cluster assembly accessory protein [Rhodanobacter sp.]
MSITITPAANERMRHFLASTPAAAGVRFGVKRTGCSGFAYVVDLADTVGDGDQMVEVDGLPLIINDTSVALVEGVV